MSSNDQNTLHKIIIKNKTRKEKINFFFKKKKKDRGILGILVVETWDIRVVNF
jgi:hypothetical protein